MSEVRLVGPEVRAETIAVAEAEAGGEVGSLGSIPNRWESVRQLVGKLAPAGRCPPKPGIGSGRTGAMRKDGRAAMAPEN